MTILTFRRMIRFFGHNFNQLVRQLKIHCLNLVIRVQTPGNDGSPQPIPQEIIPARNQCPSSDCTCSGPPLSP
ncbi:hypothetical protein DERP_003774 [Dermatophagoides pteronyssinus]|uniref:Uncharacterized protein n=1 Tax=Dermatophagoides pteronyssinus TaxID=6956 RepID=A0ABQ8JM34_DERPT|nr:hypothetical protein DERP_003774 [Dermatophagoides pteronyssinus]